MPRKWYEQGCSLRDVELQTKVIQSHGGTSHWPQSSLTAPVQASHKPGQCPVEGVELGAKQMQSETRLESGILEQHQGRHQEHWDGLKCGPEQSSGKEKLSDALRALTAAWYLMLTAFLCCRSPSMQ